MAGKVVKKDAKKKCPLCGKELVSQDAENNKVKYFCDCIGYSRPVIEIKE